MQITVKELEPCKLEVFYTADNLKISEKESEVVEVFKNAPVSGFRKGKAPLNVIKLRYKNQIHESLKRALIEDAYSESVFEKNLNVLGQPEIREATLFNNMFTCRFGVLVRPEFELKPFSYQIPTPHYDKTADDIVAQKMQELRRSYGDLQQFSDTDVVEMGDNVIVNYHAFINDEKIEALQAEGDLLTVGSTSIKDFDSNLVGMRLNEVKEFNIIFGEGAIPSFVGKEVKFVLTLVGGSKITPCALDDQLAMKLGKENYNDLHLHVSANANTTVELEKKQLFIDALTKTLIQDYTFDVPNWMAIPDAKAEAHRMNINYDTTTDEVRSLILEKAKGIVKLSLIFDKIRTEEPEAQLSEKEIYDSVREMLLTHSKSTVDTVDEDMKKILSTGEFRMIAARLLDEHTINFVLGKVTFTN